MTDGIRRTTLCYIRSGGCCLMLYRDKKPGDMNEGKWIGIGGRVEPGETPDECNVREVFEETGLTLKSSVFHGVIRFRSDEYEDEDMYLYSSDDFEPMGGELPECDEGELRWIPDDELGSLPMWEGDKAFLGRMLEGETGLSMTLSYQGGECVITDDNAPEDTDMEQKLLDTCALFAANREALAGTFRWEGDEMHRLGAALLTAGGNKADIDRMQQCDGILRAGEGFFSVFRGHLKIAVLCSMAAADDPEGFYKNMVRAYRLLKLGRKADGEIYALAALALTDAAETEEDLLALTDRASEIYVGMNLSGLAESEDDMVTAAAAAASWAGGTDVLTGAAAQCRRLLMDKYGIDATGPLAMALALCGGEPEDTCGRFAEIHEDLAGMGIKFRSDSLAVPGTLAGLGMDPEETARYVALADEELGSSAGVLVRLAGSDRRHMYAALLTAYAFAPDSNAGTFAAAAVMRSALASRFVASAVRTGSAGL